MRDDVRTEIAEPISDAEGSPTRLHADATTKSDVDSMVVAVGNQIDVLPNAHALRQLQDVGIAL